MNTLKEIEADVMRERDIKNKKISVIGGARSGVAVAKLLASHGANVFVSDSGGTEKLARFLQELDAISIPYETGGHSPRVIDADLLVISPGVPPTIPVVRDAKARGIPVLSELEIASWFCPSPIIAVTGTNGKTTTTTLIGRMLDDVHTKNIVAGNIGNAFSGALGELNGDSVAVLEVSSFQLEQIETFHPSVAVLLNITPDHLDRYEGIMQNYVAAKCRLFERQEQGDVLIYNYDDAETRHAVRRASKNIKTLAFGIDRQFDEGAYVENGKMIVTIGKNRSEIIGISEISIPGIHNLYNSMAAVLASMSVGVITPSLRATLKNFKGVEHRLEFVRIVHGISYINDSKATNVDSVWYALQAYNVPIVLLLGGRDKGNDYSRLHDLVRKHVKSIIAIGESADKVMQSFSPLVPVTTAGSMKAAVDAATAAAVNGGIVLLSPACASFDWFQDYEHRGKVFKEIVNAL